MTASTLFKAFGDCQPDIAAGICSYGTINGAGNAIKMRDEKGHLYIFQFEGKDKWSLYYGAAAVNFERSLKHDR